MKHFMIYLAAVYSVVLPLGLLIWWKIKTKEKLWSFICGSLIWIVFAMGLEQILHYFCLISDNTVSRFITGHFVFYVLYASLAAGLFEETGRLFAFKVLLRKRKDPSVSVAYGIGHGGIEAVLTLGVTYFLYVLVMNNVFIQDFSTTMQLIKTAHSIPNSVVLLAMFERFSGIMIHIGLSMIVFNGKYPLAVLLHVLADIPAGLYQMGMISLGSVEVLSFVVALISLIIGCSQYRRIRRAQ